MNPVPGVPQVPMVFVPEVPKVLECSDEARDSNHLNVNPRNQLNPRNAELANASSH